MNIEMNNVFKHLTTLIILKFTDTLNTLNIEKFHCFANKRLCLIHVHVDKYSIPYTK